MKNLTKIFMAVAVALFALSCVTDATEDLGVKLEGQGVTELTISLEESRTQLGDKADGLYPVYWSEGDAIAVNGVVSTPLASEAAGVASATFSFGEQELTYPYCVVYPAQSGAGDGTTYPVTFLATQAHTAGTFAPQAAPMYGYEVAVAEGEVQGPIQMQHLTGVLRLAIKGNGEKLTALTVAASDGKIAGDFTVDCSTGALTASESAVNTITVTLPEGGLELKADEATPIYITVPAGGHGIYTITLVSDALTDNTMIARFNSDYHKVEAGVVKEFGEITFTPNANNGEEGELVIMNVSQMKRLAQLSEVGQLGGITKVTVGATIDMSGETDWHGIELFPSIVFDGGSENGFEIKGLKAPLFGTTAATLQNIKLTDVNIVETEHPLVGTIARRLDGTMINCSAEGTLEINNTTFTTSSSMTKYDVINIGGLVGQAGGATFENCENKVDVTVKSVASADQTGVYCAVAGAVGGAHSGVSLTSVINRGAITIDTGEAAFLVQVGGLIGRMIWYSADRATAPDVKVVTKCYNYGAITTTAETANTDTKIYVGGISANMVMGITDFSDNHNHAAITFNDGCHSRTSGGIIGGSNYSPISSCTNNAPITNNGNCGHARLGGIIGGDVLCNIDKCINSAEATISNNGALTGSNNLYAGGIAASDLTITNESYADYAFDATACNITNCNNYADVLHTGKCKSIFLGGINGRTMTGAITNCTNSGTIKHIGNSSGNLCVAGINGLTCGAIDNCSNSGALVVGDGTNDPEAAGDFDVCGITFGSTGSVTNCTNTGNITISSSRAGVTDAISLRVAGIVGKMYGRIADCSNSGDISISGITKYENTVMVAGIACLTYVNANSSYADKWQNLVNSGDITLNDVGGWTGNAGCYIAGLIGQQNVVSDTLTADNRVVLYNCSNSGKISGNLLPGLASETSGKEGRTIIAGCVAHYLTTMYDADNCDNNGEIDIQTDATSHNFIGGLAGYIAQNNKLTMSTCTMQNCDNTKPITIKCVTGDRTTRTQAGEGLIVGGLYGGWYLATKDIEQDIVMKNLTNSGAITLQGNNFSSAGGRHIVAGISADHYCYGTLTNCKNSGALTIDGSYNGTGKDDARAILLGGIIGYAHSHSSAATVRTPASDLYNCINTGAVTAKNLKMVKYICTGGLIGYQANATVNAVISNCGNSGTISVDNVAGASGQAFSVGGMLGNYQETSTTFSGENVNIGNISVKNCTSDSATTQIGGFVGKTTEPIVGAKSYCDIAAIGMSGNTGMLMGIVRADATAATNCGVGGRIAYTEEEDEYYDDSYPVYTDIAGVWYEYIYSTTITEDQATTDDCALLTEKPSLPVYTAEE